MKRYLFILVIVVLFWGCGIKNTEFGVQDNYEASKIKRANALFELYRKRDYESIEQTLLKDLADLKDNESKIRISNELADLYSYRLYDIEKAIAMDEAIKQLGLSKQKSSQLEIIHDSANNIFLSDSGYKNEYLNISSEELNKRHQKRLQSNLNLLKADISANKKKYDEQFLQENLALAKDDLERTPPSAFEYVKLLSRLIKIEYELYKTTNNPEAIKLGFVPILENKLQLAQIDTSEIDFLSLSDYLFVAAHTTKNKLLGDMALKIVYKPYLNLKNTENRWTYNKLINSYINKLIDFNYALGNFQDTLYYISLNKSRMILEDKALYSKNTLKNAKNTSIAFDEYGLPQKEPFMKSLLGADGFLDFYLAGDYTKMSLGIKPKNEDYLTSTRAIKRLTSGQSYQEVFSADTLFLTYISNGKIEIKKLPSKELSALEGELESNMNSLLGGKEIKLSQSQQTTTTIGKLIEKNKKISISPDKWLSKFPLEYLLGVNNSVRTLNFFTYNATEDKVQNTNILGFFNPTNDLKEADEEMRVLQKLFPKGRYFSKEEASLSNLAKSKEHNIIHLSMHGLNNPVEPEYSKLFFAKSKLDDATQDPNALYAKNMNQIEQLKNNELVFTAACSTGLTKSSSINQSELLGILRPLLANNNKNIILTLWDVDSASAKDFVVYFYEELDKTSNIAHSFIVAKEKLKNKYKLPIYWAPYYMIQSSI